MALTESLISFPFCEWRRCKEEPRDGAVHYNSLPGQLLFCMNLGVECSFSFVTHSFVAQAAINTTSPAGPQDSSLYRLQFENVLIGYYGSVTPSAVCSLPPRPHQSTWWSAPNSDKAILNGIRWARPWRTGSVINHSVFWNTTGCWCRLEVEICICFHGALSFPNTVDLQLTYGILVMTLYIKLDCMFVFWNISIMDLATKPAQDLMLLAFVFSSSVSPSGMWNNWILHS